jgi:hypothetical protein
MNKTSFTNKNSLAGPRREKMDVPRYKGLSEKRNMINFNRKKEKNEPVYFRKKIEETTQNREFTFKPKINNPRKELAKSMNFY